jgi:peptidoglycan/xylan/chitin deacetylase (PgdA/CDA1 family)
MWRLPLSLLSPAGRSGRLSILIYHRVLREADPLFPELPSATEFEARMRWVSSSFNVLPLQQAVRQLFDGTIPARALAITFDDGYADNEELAAPILCGLGLSATFFITTGFLGGGCMWNDRVIEAVRACTAGTLDLSALGLGTHPLDAPAQRSRAIGNVLKRIKHLEQAERDRVTDAIAEAAGAAVQPALMMSHDQVRSLRAMGMEVGAHTVTHPILARLTPAIAFDEMQRGKNELEELLGEPVRLFAYPNGVPQQDYTAEHTRMARECGFDAALSTAWGAASARSDRFQLPRFTPWDRTQTRFGARMLLNFRQIPTLAT